MKLTALLVLAGVLLCGAAFATTYTQVLYPAPGYPVIQDTGLNYFAMKGVPFNPDPAVVFVDPVNGPVPIDGVLIRWDVPTATPIPYDQFNPGNFGGMLLGEGYQITVNPSPGPDGSWTISYDGAPDGLPDGLGQLTDMWVSLAGTSSSGGIQWVGHPFDHDVLWENILVTDGTTTILVQDAVAAGWLEGAWQYWDPVTQTPMAIDIFDPVGCYMHPGMMYLVPTLRSNLALIIPA